MKNQHHKVVRLLAEKSPAERLGYVLSDLMDEGNIDGVVLSKHTGVPVTTINRLRNGAIDNNPTLATLIPLAEFFNLTVSQLIGDKPLPSERIKGSYQLLKQNSLPRIPLLTWRETMDWPRVRKQPHKMIACENADEKNVYALQVESNEWENISKDTILIINTALEAQHRDLVLVRKKGQPLPTLKQLLIEEGCKYLKSLMLNQQITIFTKEYSLLGVVVEYMKKLRQ